MPLTCQPITDLQTMAAARRVRCHVFIEEQGVPEAEEWDALDATAQVVGTARLLEIGNGWFKIGRVAVLPEARGRGGGVLLMATARDQARQRGAKAVALDAELPVIPFYERLGFLVEGELFMDAGIPHRRMTRRLEGP